VTTNNRPLPPFQPFVGEWDTEGTMLPASRKSGEHFHATDSYELLPGGHFLVHRWDAHMPEGRTRGIEIFGRDKHGDDFFMHSYDDLGNTGVMTASVDDEGWTFLGESMRFHGGFSEAGDLFSGIWEFRQDPEKAWVPWMSVTLKKRGVRR
jgi:hypothetical protein